MGLELIDVCAMKNRMNGVFAGVPDGDKMRSDRERCRILAAI
jgi:hypothetical protein